MPSPHLAETERNPGSSQHHATYGSLPGLNSNHVVPSIATQHNSQVQMPIPTVHGKTPLKRTTTSPQSLQGSPFHSANISPDSTLNARSVPANPSSSRSPANPSTQVPATSAQEIHAKGPMPDSTVPKAPPEIRVDKIPTPTPPLGVGQPLNPISRKKPAINVNPPPPTPSSPASFSSHFSPGSPSMQMVESDSPATPSRWGVRRWFKKQLENLAGASPR
jgi:hypothetical protein